MRTVLVFVAVALPLLCNCATSGAGTQTPAHLFKESMVDRAAFDLGCPKDELWLHNLAGGPGPLGGITFGSQVGVTGCGKRAVYVYTSGAVWVLNGISDSPTAPGTTTDLRNNQTSAPSTP